MDIPEITIGPQQRQGRKFSPRVRRYAESYLSEKGVSLESLTDRQQRCVFKYIKSTIIKKIKLLAFVIQKYMACKILEV